MTTPAAIDDVVGLIAFLNGEGELDGRWFGDRNERGRAFWWRKYLPGVSALITSLAKERDEAQRGMRIVQNAAKTIAAAHDTQLEHLRSNATFDHRLRAEHESLLERDALMTDRVLALEAQAAASERMRDALEVIDSPWFGTDASINEIRRIAAAALSPVGGV